MKYAVLKISANFFVKANQWCDFELVLNESPSSTLFHVLTTVRFVQLNLPDLIAPRVQRVLYVDLCRVVCVRAELHGAVLPVEWEIGDLDGETSTH